MLTSQSQVQEFKEPAQKRQVSRGEDEGHDASKGNGGSSRLLPLLSLARKLTLTILDVR